MPFFRRSVGNLIALLALAVALTQVPPLVDGLHTDLRTTRDGRTPEERELEPALAADLPVQTLLGAAAEIPENASYHLVVGQNVELGPATRAAIDGLFRYWLQPRPLTSLDDAKWVIAYGESTESLGIALGKQVEIHPGVVVAQVER